MVVPVNLDFPYLFEKYQNKSLVNFRKSVWDKLSPFKGTCGLLAKTSGKVSIPFVVYPKGHKSQSNALLSKVEGYEWNQLVQSCFSLSVTDKLLNGSLRT